MNFRRIVFLQVFFILALLVNPMLYLFVYNYNKTLCNVVSVIFAVCYTVSWMHNIAILKKHTLAVYFSYLPNRIWVRFCITLCLLLLCSTVMLWSSSRLEVMAYTGYMFCAILSIQLVYKLTANVFSIAFKDAYVIVYQDYIKRIHASEIKHVIIRHHAYYMVYQNTSLYISTSYSKNPEHLEHAILHWIKSNGLILKTD
jgi:hypothetical protein